MTKPKESLIVAEMNPEREKEAARDESWVDPEEEPKEFFMGHEKPKGADRLWFMRIFKTPEEIRADREALEMEDPEHDAEIDRWIEETEAKQAAENAKRN